MARTAVIAGTATAVSGGIRDKQQAGAQQHATAAEQAAAAQQAEIQAQVQRAPSRHSKRQLRHQFRTTC
ncbi:MAG TPA: hypothetical protein VIJ18_09925 [Microbacteriaceae bacterium]